MRILMFFLMGVILSVFLFQSERLQENNRPADNLGFLIPSKKADILGHIAQNPDKLDLTLLTPVAPSRSLPVRSVPVEHAAATRASRSTRRAPVMATGMGQSGARRVASTAYCLKGRMADGQGVHSGAVAMNGVPLGTRFKVLETGTVYIVEDRIGSGSQFDIWMSSCAAAIQYGRREITLVPA